MLKLNLRKILMAFLWVDSLFSICAQTGSFSKLEINNAKNTDAAVLASSDQGNRLIVSSLDPANLNAPVFKISHEFFANPNYRNNGYISFHRGGDTYGGFLEFGSNGLERMRIDGDGKVGIGTTSPQAQLHTLVSTSLEEAAGSCVPLTRIEGNGKDNKIYINDYMLREASGVGWTTVSYMRGIGVDVSFLTPTTLRSWIKQNPFTERIEFGSSGKTFMSVGSNIRIGTDNTNGNLEVNGTISAKEVTVKDPVWADFVFDKNYKLRDLKEVDRYIQENGHLPEIPSAAEVKEKGVNIVEVQAKLLLKLEEMTLYIIELQKEVERLKAKK